MDLNGDSFNSPYTLNIDNANSSMIVALKLIVIFIGFLPGRIEISGSGLHLNSKSKLRPVNFITKFSAVVVVLCNYGRTRAAFVTSVSRLAYAACCSKSKL